MKEKWARWVCFTRLGHLECKCEMIALSIDQLLNYRKMHQMSHILTKPTKWHVRQAKTQISLGIHAFFMRTVKTDQNGQMPRLIWVFAGRTCQFVGFVIRRLKCKVTFINTLNSSCWSAKRQVLKKERNRKWKHGNVWFNKNIFFSIEQVKRARFNQKGLI